MDLEASERARLEAFIALTSGGSARDLVLQVRPLRGGLVSPSVREVFARYRDEFGKRRLFRFVVKHVDGSFAREASIYEALSSTKLRHILPSVLGISRMQGRPTHLYLECVAQDVAWPWTNFAIVTRLLHRLADVHAPEHLQALRSHVSDWNYDAELRRSAHATLELAERTEFVAQSERKSLPALRRMIQNLSQMRRQVLRVSALPPAMLHGDLHPGNVVVRWRAGENEPVLIDWARARCGSPLEDLSSWLQTLGYWEPTVQRRHDTLFSHYLRARGLPSQPSRELRDAYWLAGAMNCLSGAMSYHLELANARSVASRVRFASQHAARHCLRVIRRADGCWRV